MYPTKNDLPESVRAKVIQLCNERLADSIDLQTQCKYAHWNVKGPNFIALHKLFDEVNEDVEEYIDLIAEQIAQLGGVAKGTARMVVAGSTLSEYEAKTNLSNCFQECRTNVALLLTSLHAEKSQEFLARAWSRQQQI